MYVATVPNRGSPPAILLRESYREDGKVKTRTLKNLSDWPAERIDLLRAVLRGDQLVSAAQGVAIEQALPHGHVVAALDTARRIGLDRLLPRQGPQRRRDLALALIIARLLEPVAKLATARALDPATASHSLGVVLGLGRVAAKEIYSTLDWLGRQQSRIEAALARRHLATGTLVLYDLSSTYLEGRCCPLAQYGYSRDHRSDKQQIVFGVLCSHEGCPIAIEVFAGNTADPSTLKSQIDKLKHRFHLDRVVLVGDRGMITQARLREDLIPAGLDWITALRAPAIQALATADGPLQLSLFDERDLAEITSPDYPGERLVVCRNPLLAAERARKRNALLDATEAELARIQERVRRLRNPLHGTAAIGQAVGTVLGRRKMASIFGSASPITSWLSHATRSRSLPKPGSTGSTCCAPASHPANSTPPTRCAPTRAWPMSNAPFAASRASISRSGQCFIGPSRGSAPMSFCACSPTISNGTCEALWPRCCSTTMTAPPRRSAAPRWLQPRSHRRHAARRQQS